MESEALSIEEINKFKEEKARIQKVRKLFIIPGAILCFLPIIPILATINHVDAHSYWFPPLFMSMLALILVGIALVIAGSAYYRHRLWKLIDTLNKYSDSNK